MYNPDDIPLPGNYAEMPLVNFGWTDGRDESIEAYPRRPERIRQHIADYYAMISHIDTRVGLVLDALEERGMAENTIVVLMGDNGLAIGQHGLMGKQNLYEHSVNVPLVMAGPGIPAGMRSEKLCYLMDVYPTLCDLCGVEIPASVEAKSLAPIFAQPDTTVRDALYLAFQGRMRGVMDERYKLIAFRTEKLKLTQLFDLQNDPWELNNCYDVPGYREIGARLEARMLELSREWDDRLNEDGDVFWQAYDRYESAAVKNPRGPSGADVKKQMQISQ